MTVHLDVNIYGVQGEQTAEIPHWHPLCLTVDATVPT